MQVRRAVDALEVKRLVEHGRLDHCRGAAAVLQARARVPSPGASRVRAGPSLLLCGNLLHVVGHRVRAARLLPVRRGGQAIPPRVFEDEAADEAKLGPVRVRVAGQRHGVPALHFRLGEGRLRQLEKVAVHGAAVAVGGDAAPVTGEGTYVRARDALGGRGGVAAESAGGLLCARQHVCDGDEGGGESQDATAEERNLCSLALVLGVHVRDLEPERVAPSGLPDARADVILPLPRGVRANCNGQGTNVTELQQVVQQIRLAALRIHRLELCARPDLGADQCAARRVDAPAQVQHGHAEGLLAHLDVLIRTQPATLDALPPVGGFEHGDGGKDPAGATAQLKRDGGDGPDGVLVRHLLHQLGRLSAIVVSHPERQRGGPRACGRDGLRRCHALACCRGRRGLRKR
mmetsp:Transcript_32924/g.106469  ORF Transcript_32924/g.106469 Transcript_32924/m.106469 type:complete len:404 (-) Transcript_32924:278-1489(-)